MRRFQNATDRHSPARALECCVKDDVSPQKTRDGSNLAFLFSRSVAEPTYLLIHPSVLLFLFIVLRLGFTGEIGILVVVSCFGQ